MLPKIMLSSGLEHSAMDRAGLVVVGRRALGCSSLSWPVICPVPPLLSLDFALPVWFLVQHLKKVPDLIPR